MFHCPTSISFILIHCPCNRLPRCSPVYEGKLNTSGASSQAHRSFPHAYNAQMQRLIKQSPTQSHIFVRPTSEETILKQTKDPRTLHPLTCEHTRTCLPLNANPTPNKGREVTRCVSEARQAAQWKPLATSASIFQASIFLGT